MNKLFLSFCAGVLAVFAASPASAGDIIISEIHYNPLMILSSNGDTTSGDNFEFIELKNTGTAEVDISGYKFIAGIEFIFPAGSKVAAGGYYILSRSKLYFKMRYGINANAEYVNTAFTAEATNKLSNKGEKIVLVNTAKDTIFNMTYDTKYPWPVLADGLGFSLVPTDESADLTQSKNWRNSTEINGSPGKADPVPTTAPIYINEILANSVAPAVDSIELYNPNATAVDISGWQLSDKLGVDIKNWQLSDKLSLLQAYTFPAGTIIQPKSYLVLAQGQITAQNVVTAGNPLNFGFGLSSSGEDIYLFSTKDGSFTGYTNGFSFVPTHANKSYSRLLNSENRLIYAETEQTFGKANTVMPVPNLLVFEEIMYAPAAGQYEYVKVKNISNQAIDLKYWSISGISTNKKDFVGTLAAGESFYAVENLISPADFRTKMELPATALVFSFYGSLKNEGEEIEIKQPTNAMDSTAAYYVVETVRYDNKTPWPIVEGIGSPIIRINTAVFGNEPTNWKAGEVLFPTANITGDASAALNGTVNLSAAASTDPKGKSLTYQWVLISPSKAETQLAADQNVSFSATETGTYIVKLIVSNGTLKSYPVSFSISVLTTGNEQLANNCVSVFPTVTNDEIHLVAATDGWSYILETITGSSISEEKLTGNSAVVSLKSSKLDTGWVMVILSDSQQVYVQKVFYTGK